MRRSVAIYFLTVAALGFMLSLSPLSCSCSNSDSNTGGDVDMPDPDPNVDRDRADGEDVSEKEELKAQCQKDEDCPLGRYCGAFNQCLQDCASDQDCGESQFCNGFGRCSDLRNPDTDAEVQPCPTGSNDECPTGYVCSADGKCVEGCSSRADCHIGMDCISGTCQEPSTDGDEESACSTSQDCPEGYDCSGGVCVPQQFDVEPDQSCNKTCNSLEDCDPGSYCGDDGCCHIDCLNDEECGAGKICIEEIGKCVVSGGDEEIDLPESEHCNSDSDCPVGTYCKNSTCDFDCVLDSECDEGKICDSRGRCSLPSDEDEAESQDAEQITCANDEECPAGNFCTPLGVCGFECIDDSNCGENQFCDPRGRCKTIGGDSDSEVVCINDEDCPSGFYCNIERMCTYDCTQNSDCPNGMQCDPRGRCYATGEDSDDGESQALCTTDDDCPDKHFCAFAGEDQGFCIQECTTSADCGAVGAWECDDRGRCVQLDSDETEQDPGYCGPNPPLVTACAQDNDCRVIISTNNCECAAVGSGEMRTEFVSYIMRDGACVPDPNVCETSGCNVMMPKCVDGECTLVAPSDQDEEMPEGWCEYDAQCPSGFYCDIPNNQCKQDCVENTDCNYPEEYCNDIGKCLPMNPPDGDEVDAEQEEEVSDTGVVSCTQDTDCPTGSYCLLGVCHTSCTQDSDCPPDPPGNHCNVERGRCESDKPK